jgi:hypothetical protein
MVEGMQTLAALTVGAALTGPPNADPHEYCRAEACQTLAASATHSRRTRDTEEI